MSQVPHATSSSTKLFRTAGSKIKKAGANCCVVGCKNNTLNSPGTRFYVFSRVYYKQAQTEKWITAVRRKNPDGTPWEPKKYSRICSQHFIGNKKSDHPYSPSFVPTIFPEVTENVHASKKSAKGGMARYERGLAGQTDSAESSRKRLEEVSSELHSGFEYNLARRSDLPESSCEQYIRVSREPLRDARFCSKREDASRASHCHRGTQIDFSDPTMDLNIFICNRYVNGRICEAESQACFPKMEAHRETKRAYRDAEVGPEPTNLPENSLSNSVSGFQGFSSITKDREMIDLAGVTLDTFRLLLRILEGSKESTIPLENRLLIFLIKMKQDLDFSALSLLFDSDRVTISRSFRRTLKFLSHACKNFVLWSSREVLQSRMPTTLKKNCKSRRVVVDWANVKIEKPRDIEQRLQFYSNDKKAFVVKFLIGCTTNGLISFVSKLYGGETGHAEIARNSGLLDLLEAGDVVVTTKGSPELRSAVEDTGKEILLAMPRCSRDNDCSTEETTEADVVASVRVQTARTMRRIKCYGILSKLRVNMLAYSDNILFMCCVLTNLQSRYN